MTPERQLGLKRAMAAAAVLFPSIYYLWAMAPSLTWLDSGEIVAAGASLGTAHPPGSPLYFIIAGMLSRVLPGNVAFRYNLVSLLLAAATIAAARALILEVLQVTFRGRDDGSPSFRLLSELVASCAAAAMAFVPAFAVQALRAEVYTLSALVSTLFIWACLRAIAADGEERLRAAGAALFLAGLGLSVHNLSIVLLLPVAAVGLGFAARDVLETPRRIPGLLAAGGGMLMLSLIPFLYEPIRSAACPFIDYSHVGSARDFLDVFMASAYRKSFGGPGRTADLAGNALLVWQAVGRHVLPAILAFAAGGVLILLRRRRALLGACLLGIVVSVLGLLFQSSIYPDNLDHGAYVYPAVLLTALLAGVAVRWVGELRIIARGFGGRPAVGRTCSSFLAVTLVLSQMLSGLERTSMRDSTTASAHADLLDRILPANAFVFVNNDEVAFPLVYIQAAEGRRLDVVAGSTLMLGRSGAYAAARSIWGDRLPPPAAVDAGGEGGAKLRPESLLDAILSHTGGRCPLLWDQSDDKTVEPRYLVPYYHLAAVIPDGREDLRQAWKGRGGESELVKVFYEFFDLPTFRGPDLFPFWRLARWPLGITALLHFYSGNLHGFEVVTSLALEYAPDDPMLLYNRALAFEQLGELEAALRSYKLSLKAGYRDVEVGEAIARVKGKMAHR
jgi:hypothetical protein